ncbi:hypothetical protein L9F63_027913, partial [Diploptera punctata]
VLLTPQKSVIMKATNRAKRSACHLTSLQKFKTKRKLSSDKVIQARLEPTKSPSEEPKVSAKRRNETRVLLDPASRQKHHRMNITYRAASVVSNISNKRVCE